MRNEGCKYGSRWVVALLAALVTAGWSGAAEATAVFYNDGGTHTIEAAGDLDVIVSNGTTVHVQAGGAGEFLSTVTVQDSSVVVIEGGTVGDVGAFGVSTVEIFGGLIENRLECHDQSEANVYGVDLTLTFMGQDFFGNQQWLLTGTLADGTVIELAVFLSADGAVLLHEAPIAEEIEVEVVLKPGDNDDEPAPINLGSGGRIPVAIYSHADFDATAEIDVASVLLGDPVLGGQVAAVRTSTDDINGNGFDDLILHFSTPEMVDADAIDEQTKILMLTGQTVDGINVFGLDEVKVVQP